MNQLRQVTPFLSVPDLETALRFFEGVLGFGLRFRMEEYAYLSRDEAGLRVVGEDGRAVVSLQDARTTVYFDVRDVDELYAELAPRLATCRPIPLADRATSTGASAS